MRVYCWPQLVLQLAGILTLVEHSGGRTQWWQCTVVMNQAWSHFTWFELSFTAFPVKKPFSNLLKVPGPQHLCLKMQTRRVAFTFKLAIWLSSLDSACVLCYWCCYCLQPPPLLLPPLLLPPLPKLRSKKTGAHAAKGRWHLNIYWAWYIGALGPA